MSKEPTDPHRRGLMRGIVGAAGVIAAAQPAPAKAAGDPTPRPDATTYASATALAALIATDQLDAVALTRACLACR